MRHSRRSAVAALGGLAAVTMIGAGAAYAADSAAPTGPAPAVHAWVTTPDRTLALSDQGTAPFLRQLPAGSPDRLTITVDPSRTYQTLVGFGASLTESSAAVLVGQEPDEGGHGAERSRRAGPRRGPRAWAFRWPRRPRSSRRSGRRCGPPACGRRSSGTTPTGPSTPTTSPPPPRVRTRSCTTPP